MNATKIFRTETSANLAVHLEIALDRLATAGVDVIKLTEGAPPGDKLLALKVLEERAVPLIQGIVKTIKPEFKENVRAMDERSIWRAFWELRQGLKEPKITIFAILAELNSNPSRAPTLAK